jgi:hypothetical protein
MGFRLCSFTWPPYLSTYVLIRCVTSSRNGLENGPWIQLEHPTGCRRWPPSGYKYPSPRNHRLFPVPLPTQHNTNQPTLPPCRPNPTHARSSDPPLPDLYKRPPILNSSPGFLLPPPNRSPPRCRGRDLRCFNLGVDGGGGGGAGGERAGRSLPAPLRHRPHAPVSPPPIPQRSSCRGDFLGAASRWALVDCFAAK